MDPKGTVLTEISHTGKDKYCMISLICGILKKQATNKKNKNKTKKKTVAPEFIETENRGRELGVGETGKDGRWSNDTNLHL